MKDLTVIFSGRTVQLSVIATMAAGLVLGTGCRLRLHNSFRGETEPAEIVTFAPARAPVSSLQENYRANDIQGRTQEPQPAEVQKPAVAQEPVKAPAPVATRNVEVAETPLPDGRPVLYRIKKGDTYSQISQRFLGKAKYWPQIHHLNADQKPAALTVGALILIPQSSAKAACP